MDAKCSDEIQSSNIFAMGVLLIEIQLFCQCLRVLP